MAEFSLTQRTGICLSRRFRSAEAFTVESGPVEATNASLPSGEHRAGIRENDETRSQKSESKPNDEIRNAPTEKKQTGATPAELICESLRNLWTILGARSA